MDVAPIIGGVAGYVIGITCGILVGLIVWKRRRHPGLLIVGLRPSSRKARVREVETQRGIYKWTEKDFEADIPLGEAMHYEAGEYGTMVLVDLESYHPVSYEGRSLDAHGTVVVQDKDKDGKPSMENGKPVLTPRLARPIKYDGSCLNDRGPVSLITKDGAVLAVAGGPDAVASNGQLIPDVWLRLSGTRLAKIRKDTRIEQMNHVVQSWWMSLTRFTPVAICIVGVLCLLILGFVAKMAMG